MIVESVARWPQLATADLRERVQQLVAARLDPEHAVWSAIREDPVLAARVRGVLSGLESAAERARDRQMQLVWIAHAKQSLGPRPAPARGSDPAADPAPDQPDPTGSPAVAGAASAGPPEPVEVPTARRRPSATSRRAMTATTQPAKAAAPSAPSVDVESAPAEQPENQDPESRPRSAPHTGRIGKPHFTSPPAPTHTTGERGAPVPPLVFQQP